MADPVPANPGETPARLLFQRIIRHCNDTLPRHQVIALVAGILGVSPLVVVFDIGLDNIQGWKPQPSGSTGA